MRSLMRKPLWAIASGLALAAACASDDGQRAAGTGGSGGTQSGPGDTSAGTGGELPDVVQCDAVWFASVTISVLDAVTCAPVTAELIVDGWDGGFNTGNRLQMQAPSGCYAVRISAPGYQAREVAVRIDGPSASDAAGCIFGSNNRVTVTLHPLDGGAEEDADGGDAFGDAGVSPSDAATCNDKGDLNCGAPVTAEAGAG